MDIIEYERKQQEEADMDFPSYNIYGDPAKFNYDVFIPNNTPSLKNSKIATKHGVFFSKSVAKYLRLLGIKSYSVNRKTYTNYVNRPNIFEDKVSIMKEIFSTRTAPHTVGLFFIRDSKRKFDWLNAAQIICDLLVAHGVIEDDNMDFLIPRPVQILGRWYAIDKEEPGCRIFY